MTKEVIWIGSQPTNCQLCNEPLQSTFIDGRTRLGHWAIMCPECHMDQAIGLGVGKGQMYAKQTDGRWQKVAG